MKREFDKNGRTIYKFSHSACQGGWVYIHRTMPDSIIKNKEGLRNVLNAISKHFKLIDTTIRVYDSFLFLFFMTRTVAPQNIIDSIQKNIQPFSEWDEDYVYMESMTYRKNTSGNGSANKDLITMMDEEILEFY